MRNQRFKSMHEQGLKTIAHFIPSKTPCPNQNYRAVSQFFHERTNMFRKLPEAQSEPHVFERTFRHPFKSTRSNETVKASCGNVLNYFTSCSRTMS